MVPSDKGQTVGCCKGHVVGCLHVGDNRHVVRMSPSITTQTVHGFHYLGRILCLVNIRHYPFSELAINIPVKEFSLESGHSKISSSNNNKKMGLYNKRYNFKS